MWLACWISEKPQGVQHVITGMNSLGVPGKGEAFVGERRSSEMRELPPTAEAKDMKLAPTIWRARSFPAWLACWTPETNNLSLYILYIERGNQNESEVS